MSSRIILLLSAALSIAAPRAMAQPAGFLMDSMKAVSDGQYLRAITLLESNRGESREFDDILGMLYAVVGEWERAEELRPPAARKYTAKLPEGCRLVPAIDEIARVAKSRRIVVINEAHDAPEHRAFIGRLAERLKENGFSHYAFETLSESPRALVQRGYPLRTTGFYSCEPRFGELVRDVLNRGLTPIRYEAEHVKPTGDRFKDINAREAAQCRNLVARVFSKDSEARILIHVGLDHVMEKPKRVGNQQIEWLAARLKQATGIDPLTIDQVTRLQPPAAEHTQPATAFDPRGKRFIAGPYNGYVDLQVYHPPTKKSRGKPHWLTEDNRRRLVNIPNGIEAGSTRVLVQAHYVREEGKTVPADQVLLMPKRAKPALSLKPGTYRITVQDENGKQLSTQSLNVK